MQGKQRLSLISGGYLKSSQTLRCKYYLIYHLGVTRHGPGSGRALCKELPGRYVKEFTLRHLLLPGRTASSASELITQHTVPSSIFHAADLSTEKGTDPNSYLVDLFFNLCINLFICI